MADDPRQTFGPISYRRLDQGLKLLGVGLVAVGLEIGGGSTLGLAFGVAGVACVLGPLVLVPADDAADDEASASGRDDRGT